MSFETMKRQCSAFSTLVLTRSMSKQGSVRTPMISSTRAVEAASSRMSRDTAKEIMTSSARLQYLVDVLGREIISSLDF